MAKIFQVPSGVSVLQMRQGEAGDGLGEEMYDAVKCGKEMPAAVDFEDDDSPELRKIKELIVTMTSHERTARPTAEAVLQVLRDMRL